MSKVDVVELAKLYSQSAANFQRKYDQYQEDIATLDEMYRPELQDLAVSAEMARRNLAQAIENNSPLFMDKKTLEVNDVKFGYMKKKAKYRVEDEANAIQIIKSLLPDKQYLINVKESISLTNLNKLSKLELRDIGGFEIPGGNEIWVKLKNDVIEKEINKYLPEDNNEEEN